MNKKPIILIGGGGHCKSMIEVIESAGKFQIKGIVDVAEKVGESILGYPIIGTDGEISSYVDGEMNFHITVGQIYNASLRIKLHQKVKAAGGLLPVVSASTSMISKHATVEEGTAVMHQVVINAGVGVGACSILNTGCLVEHDAQVGDFTHVSTKSVLNGDVTVGDRCFVGSGAILSNGVIIPSDTLIAAGSTVYKSLKLPGTYIGFPLRKIK